MNILLIQGGWSSECEVSLKSAAVIESTLIHLGHQVTSFDPATSLSGLLSAAENADFAFIALHGSPGEDGLIQSMLESVGCPYQGSGPAGSYEQGGGQKSFSAARPCHSRLGFTHTAA